MTLREMYAELRKQQAEARKISDEMRTAGPLATEEQRKAYNTAIDAALVMSDSIQREEEMRHSDEVLKGGVNEESFGKVSEEKRKAAEYRSALIDYLRSGSSELSNESRKILAEHRAMNTGSNTDGGYVVDVTTLHTVQEEKVTWGAIYAAARKLPTQTGNTIQWPVSLEGMTRGVIVGEGANHGKKDTQFKNKSLGAFKISSQIILVTDELIQDAFIDIANYVTAIARKRVELGIDYYAVNGKGGTTEPEGLLLQIDAAKKVPFVPSGAVGSSAYGSALYDVFIDVIHRVDAAYRGMASYGIAINDKTLATVRKWKDENGHPIYINDVTRDWPETLFGKKLIIDNQIPDIGTDGFIVAGDWNSLIIREAGSMVIKRFNELYGETGHVGFLAWQRFGIVLEDVAAMAMAVMGTAESASTQSIQTEDENTENTENNTGSGTENPPTNGGFGTA